MTTELSDCANCSTKFKGGLLSSVSPLSENKVRIINEYHDNKASGYCNKCGSELYSRYKFQVISERDSLSHKMTKLIDTVPVISTHSPLNWDYDILSMVTGQSTTGTGVISEFTSSFSDLFGVQSGRFNKKLKGGEEICFAQLRKQALDLGGNAIIATDIDYSEVGGDKGMLMVCMGGTAIKLKNTAVLGQERADRIVELAKLNERMKVLNSFNTDEF